MGNVYLLSSESEEGFISYKIGITKGCVNKRIKSLQTGNPNRIELINTYRSSNYRKIESWFHRIYASNRLEGEWFILNKGVVNNFVNEAKKIDNNIKALKDNPFFK